MEDGSPCVSRHDRPSPVRGAVGLDSRVIRDMLISMSKKANENAKATDITNMGPELHRQQMATLDAILRSSSAKKVVVAGPGTGKTYLFKRMLEELGETEHEPLIVTFINNLKDELERDLGHLAKVYTFHGYCRHVLHQKPKLRGGLTENFRYFPPLVELVKSDWAIIDNTKAPTFMKLMRDLEEGKETDFYLHRSTYYDAVSFDDSVFRVFGQLRYRPEHVDGYDLVLVDEYQDFNRLEVSLIELLAAKNTILIAGDDDQALYIKLRSSSPKFIRDLHRGGLYEPFSLPFCMRCTEAVVGAIQDIVSRAQILGYLRDRIDKPYTFFPPTKGADSKSYPTIEVVKASVQSGSSNYFGQYIDKAIARIPADEIRVSVKERFPTVLVIGPKQYLRQIRKYLESHGRACEISEDDNPFALDRELALRMIKESPEANLGWRIMLAIDAPAGSEGAIKRSHSEGQLLVELVGEAYRDRVLAEAGNLGDETGDAEGSVAVDEETVNPIIKLTSFEGSKGLSAQHVFIVGLQEGELPKNAAAISDLEICKVLVALTRTRKKCYLMYTYRWAGQPKRPSIFLEWIAAKRKTLVSVDKTYWKSH